MAMVDDDYDYTTYTSPASPLQPHDESESSPFDGDEALLDLAQLEELHKEAEKMKALGNKHMATQVCRDCNVFWKELRPLTPSSSSFSCCSFSYYGSFLIIPL